MQHDKDLQTTTGNLTIKLTDAIVDAMLKAKRDEIRTLAFKVKQAAEQFVRSGVPSHILKCFDTLPEYFNKVRITDDYSQRSSGSLYNIGCFNASCPDRVHSCARKYSEISAKDEATKTAYNNHHEAVKAYYKAQTQLTSLIRSYKTVKQLKKELPEAAKHVIVMAKPTEVSVVPVKKDLFDYLGIKNK